LTIDPKQSYGIFDAPGFYGTTVTRPDFFEAYYLEQLTLLIERYRKPILVGLSDWPIPLSFVVDYSASTLTSEHIEYLKLKFELPKLTRITDEIVNHTYKTNPQNPKPLALFSGERVDFSLHRLHHYTGTSAEHFQNFILLTNYQRYVDEFIRYGLDQIQNGDKYNAFVEPGDIVIPNLHLSKNIPEKGAPPILFT
jgi:AMP nucleosidase